MLLHFTCTFLLGIGDLGLFEPHVFTSLRTILLDAEEDGMGALCQGPTPCLLEEVSHLLYP